MPLAWQRVINTQSQWGLDNFNTINRRIVENPFISDFTSRCRKGHGYLNNRGTFHMKALCRYEFSSGSCSRGSLRKNGDPERIKANPNISVWIVKETNVQTYDIWKTHQQMVRSSCKLAHL